MKIDPAMRLIRSASPVETLVGSEIVLMDVDSGKCFGLGETGSEIWRLFATPTTPAEAALTLSQEYDAPAETIEADVLALLEQLYEHHLVTVC